jgi:3-oxoacyl-(acyl-carrier-protein) synthase
LPANARREAAGRSVVAIPRPALAGDRFRRATRECLLAVAAVDAMLVDGGLGREGIRGPGTGLVYVTAAAYAASNRAFIEEAKGTGTLHFPYTAPSAVPAEAASEFGLTGPYVILLGGSRTTAEALWQAAALLRHGACERVVALAVETFAECADLFARARWLVRRPLVEAAAAVLLTPGGGEAELERVAARAAAAPLAGETLACGPLIALALARAREQKGAPGRP